MLFYPKAIFFLLPFFATIGASSNNGSQAIGQEHRLRSAGLQSAASAADDQHRHLYNIGTTVSTIREEIRQLIRGNNDLAPKFLRLAFHDLLDWIFPWMLCWAL